jgi:hypothetical protein
MSVLDLRRCPICRAESSLVRQTIKLKGERHVAYECLECNSQLLWLGDDLWLQADRWAYQKIGRSEMEYLLQRSMTADELRALASGKIAPGDGKRKPQSPPAGATIRVERPRPVERAAPPQTLVPTDTGGAAAAAPAIRSATAAPPDSRQASIVPQAPEDQHGYVAAEPSWAPEQQRTWDYGPPPVPVREPYPAWSEPSPVARRRGRGSPFFMLSVGLALLCLICSSVAIIASTTFTGRVPLAVQATQGPTMEFLPSATLAATEPPPAVESPVPTESPQPIPTGVAALQFQGVTDYVAPAGTHYVVGEVLNTTESNLWFVQILVTFYDGAGQVIGGGSTYTERSIVEAGSSAPFKLATLDPPPGLASYKLSFDYQTTDQSPLSVELLDYSSFSDDAGWHHIVGDVRNDHEFAVKFPEIIATYYDASHKVIRVEMALSQLNAIQPGEISPFEVVLPDPPPELHHYALQTEALRQ